MRSSSIPGRAARDCHDRAGGLRIPSGERAGLAVTRGQRQAVRRRRRRHRGQCAGGGGAPGGAGRVCPPSAAAAAARAGDARAGGQGPNGQRHHDGHGLQVQVLSWLIVSKVQAMRLYLRVSWHHACTGLRQPQLSAGFRGHAACITSPAERVNESVAQRRAFRHSDQMYQASGLRAACMVCNVSLAAQQSRTHIPLTRASMRRSSGKGSSGWTPSVRSASSTPSTGGDIAIPATDVEICYHPDGRAWILGAGNFGKVRLSAVQLLPGSVIQRGEKCI